MPFSGFKDFDPRFAEALQPMLLERPGITINSGYRTPERQAELFAQALAKYGSVQEARIHVAPAPGTYGSQGSRHNFGLAADLGYASDADRQWAHQNAARFGLNFRMGHEPWHIELAGANIKDSQRNKDTPVAVNQPNGQPINQYMLSSQDPQQQQQQPNQISPESFDFIPPRRRPILPIQTASPNVFSLANLISPRDVKAQRAEDILKRIRDYS